MKINLTSILGLVVIILLGIIFFQSPSKSVKARQIQVPITIPQQRGALPLPKNSLPNQVYIYVPIKEEVDTTLLSKFRKENDSLKELLYRDAITNRVYKETFEDSLVSFDVEVKLRGHLRKLSIPSYTIKEREQTFTYLPPREVGLFGGIELGVPTLPNTSFIVKANLELYKDNLIYKVGYDTDKRIWGGLSLKLL